MKKLLVMALAAAVAVSASAQVSDRANGTTNKKGYQILPKAGDFAISIDANPIVDFFGNAFNGDVNNSIGGFDYKDDVFNTSAIAGKYFLENNMAIRVKLHMGFNTNTYRNMVSQYNNAADPLAKVEDEWKQSQSAFGLRAGLEWRRGYGRLQGFYGAEVGVGFSSSKDTYSWGNALDPGDAAGLATGVPSTDWSNPAGLPYMPTGTDARTLEIKSGANFTALVGGFAGVEYFFARKMSLGGEVNFGLTFSSQGKGEEYTEAGDNTSGSWVIKRETEKQYGSTPNKFNFGNRAGANLFLTFHF